MHGAYANSRYQIPGPSSVRPGIKAAVGGDSRCGFVVRSHNRLAGNFLGTKYSWFSNIETFYE